MPETSRLLAGEEDEEPGGDEVVAEAEELEGKQRGRHDDADAVDGPEDLAQLRRPDEGAGEAEGAADREADGGGQVEARRRGAAHAVFVPKARRVCAAARHIAPSQGR